MVNKLTDEERKRKNREYQKKYRESHKQAIKERKRQYYQQNKEQLKAKSTEWYYTHNAQAVENRIQYYNTHKNLEKFQNARKEYAKQYRHTENAQKSQEAYRQSENGQIKRKQWYIKNKDNIIEQCKQRYSKNKNIILLQNKEKRMDLRNKIINNEISIDDLRFRNLNGYEVEIYTHIPKHRIIMRCFDKSLEVHHIDMNRQNNIKDNLIILTPSQHISLHNKMRAENKIYTRADIIHFIETTE